MDNKFYVYILETERGTLYCGFTNDLEKRYSMHINGKGAKYTKANKPLRLVYSKEFKTKSEALKEEYRIKKTLSRSQKLDLIKTAQSQS